MSRRKVRYGAGRLTAAILGAPVAGMLVAVALPALVPTSSDLRYLAACIAVVPLMAGAPVLALSARTGARAWAGAGVATVAALFTIWKSLP